MQGLTQEQRERDIAAASERNDDSLKNWTRPHQDGCFICSTPLPLEVSESFFWTCCGKTVCKGCIQSQIEAHTDDYSKVTICPFCREDVRKYNSKEFPAKYMEQVLKLANTGHAKAIYRVAGLHFKGNMGLQEDKAEGLRLYHCAVEAGSARAAFFLGMCFLEGDGVNVDFEQTLGYLQRAADLGLVHAFFFLGLQLMTRGEVEEAMLNYRKAAVCGLSYDDLFDELRNGFREGFITKEEYAFTLRENQAACDEMKSDARERYTAWMTR